MKEETYIWNCSKCGRSNYVTSLDCVKCDKQRWSQLGFSREDALEIQTVITPKRRPRKEAA